MLYETGTRVRTKPYDTPGHTRLPKYLLGKPATVVAALGEFPLPDERARDGGGVLASELYTVEFRAKDVWNDAGAGGFIRADLFEAYLEPA